TMFDRTLIAVYTTDGSRSPAATSYGDTPNAKNTLVLAGGMIRGGYFGDITVAGTNDFRIHAPDPTTGAPMGPGTRVKSGAAWRTVAKALDIPDDVAGKFPGASEKPLSFLLRS
ncbi:MAG: hypothetical protein KC416_10915, partial [Myxococcales bacterium]|nr:hypothetical protein [Myxococcales bacterium]